MKNRIWSAVRVDVSRAPLWAFTAFLFAIIAGACKLAHPEAATRIYLAHAALAPFAVMVFWVRAEKREGLSAWLSVTPLRPHEYLAAKALVLTTWLALENLALSLAPPAVTGRPWLWLPGTCVIVPVAAALAFLVVNRSLSLRKAFANYRIF